MSRSANCAAGGCAGRQRARCQQPPGECEPIELADARVGAGREAGQIGGIEHRQFRRQAGRALDAQDRADDPVLETSQRIIDHPEILQRPARRSGKRHRFAHETGIDARHSPRIVPHRFMPQVRFRKRSDQPVIADQVVEQPQPALPPAADKIGGQGIKITEQATFARHFAAIMGRTAAVARHPGGSIGSRRAGKNIGQRIDRAGYQFAIAVDQYIGRAGIDRRRVEHDPVPAA